MSVVKAFPVNTYILYDVGPDPKSSSSQSIRIERSYLAGMTVTAKWDDKIQNKREQISTEKYTIIVETEDKFNLKLVDIISLKSSRDQVNLVIDGIREYLKNAITKVNGSKIISTDIVEKKSPSVNANNLIPSDPNLTANITNNNNTSFTINLPPFTNNTSITTNTPIIPNRPLSASMPNIPNNSPFSTPYPVLNKPLFASTTPVPNEPKFTSIFVNRASANNVSETSLPVGKKSKTEEGAVPSLVDDDSLKRKKPECRLCNQEQPSSVFCDNCLYLIENEILLVVKIVCNCCSQKYNCKIINKKAPQYPIACNKCMSDGNIFKILSTYRSDIDNCVKVANEFASKCQATLTQLSPNLVKKHFGEPSVAKNNTFNLYIIIRGNEIVFVMEETYRPDSHPGDIPLMYRVYTQADKINYCGSILKHCVHESYISSYNSVIIKKDDTDGIKKISK